MHSRVGLRHIKNLQNRVLELRNLVTPKQPPPQKENVQGQNFSFVSPGPGRKFWEFFGKIWKVNKIVHVNKKVPYIRLTSRAGGPFSKTFVCTLLTDLDRCGGYDFQDLHHFKQKPL